MRATRCGSQGAEATVGVTGAMRSWRGSVMVLAVLTLKQLAARGHRVRMNQARFVRQVKHGVAEKDSGL
jgi:hypothetical protein